MLVKMPMEITSLPRSPFDLPMDGWMDRWMDGCIHTHRCTCCILCACFMSAPIRSDPIRSHILLLALTPSAPRL